MGLEHQTANSASHNPSCIIRNLRFDVHYLRTSLQGGNLTAVIFSGEGY